MYYNRFPLLFGRRRRDPDEFTLTATTTTTPQTVTIQQLTPTGRNVSIDWGDGTASEAIADGYTDPLTHAYASAGTYPIRVTGASSLTAVDLRVAQLNGLDTRQLRRSRLTHFRAHDLGSAVVSRVHSADMSLWTPTDWWLLLLARPLSRSRTRRHWRSGGDPRRAAPRFA